MAHSRGVERCGENTIETIWKGKEQLAVAGVVPAVNPLMNSPAGQEKGSSDKATWSTMHNQLQALQGAGRGQTMTKVCPESSVMVLACPSITSSLWTWS